MNTAQVISCLRAGKTVEAKALAQRQLSQDPLNPNTLYAMGLCELMSDNIPAAIDWLNQAHTNGKTDIACFTNLGVAYLKNNQFASAKSYFLKVIQQDPHADLARYNLATLYLQDEQVDAAITEFDKLVLQHPTNTQYLSALADTKREQGHFDAAIQLYDKVLELDPLYEPALLNAVKLQLYGGLLSKAIDTCQAALDQDSKCFQALRYLGDCLAAKEDFEAAMTAYADAYDINQKDTHLCCAIGNMWVQAQDMIEAATWFEAAIALDAENLAAHCGVIRIIKEMGDIDRALADIEPLLQSHPEDENILLLAADLHWENGDAHTAMTHLETLKKLQPHHVPVMLKSAQILSSSGEVKKAIEHYHAVLHKFPYSIPALSGLAIAEKEKTDPAFIQRMHRLLSDANLLDASKSQVCFGLSHYYDGTKDYEQAAALSRDANTHQWRINSKIRWHYDPQENSDYISTLMSVFNAEYFNRLKQNSLGSSDERPVFIVAMPRSGTTLTEQILARHSQVLGIGERPFMNKCFHTFCGLGGSKAAENDKITAAFSALDPEKIAHFSAAYLEQLNRLRAKSSRPNAIRIVDKMPDNYSLIGWILTLFPKARIIHCHRDPCDVALSCWMTQFAAIPWANNIDHLTTRIEQYQRIMNHWQQVIPDRFFQFEYADLVNAQTSESQALVEYLGLEWEPQCLKFYESDHLVRTASITQVRQPIYTKSVQRWRRYQNDLPDLFSPILNRG